jgi:hypothetical protein
MTTDPKKVYIVSPYNDHSVHVEQITELNPDIILLWCDVEYGVADIFKDFLVKILGYLRSNNKSVTILYPGPDKKLSEYIYLEKTYGFYLTSLAMVADRYSDRNFDNIHLEADRLYTLYSHRGSPERISIIDTLARENLLKDGIVTFHGIHMNYTPNWQYHDGSNLSDEDNYVVPHMGQGDPFHFPKSYFKGFVDIVCESRVDGQEYFLTEKTAKSIVALKPFLALSSQYYHRYMTNEYGILPYSEIFDYSFDKSPNVNDRIEGIVHNIHRLKSMDKNEVHRKLFDKLVHNKNQFIKYGLNRSNIVSKSLEFVFNEPYIILGDEIATELWFKMIRKRGWLK